MGTQRRQPRPQTGRTNYRANDFNANSFHKESFPTFKWWLHSTLHRESALWCLLTHWEITSLLWWKWLPCREKGSKLLIGGWSLAEVWLIGKRLLLRYISWRTIYIADGQNDLFCFGKGRTFQLCSSPGGILQHGSTLGVITVPPQRGQCEDTGLHSVISCSIPDRSSLQWSWVSNCIDIKVEMVFTA